MTGTGTPYVSLEGNRFRRLLVRVKRYDHAKYWRRRAVVVDPQARAPMLLKLYYLFWIKRVDAFHGCSFGTNLGAGAHFAAPPQLPHGPVGIFVGHDVRFGRDVRIFHQVTVFHGGGTIGDNVLLGAGSKVLSGVNIGAKAKVGANCVVVEDIPEEATVVMPKPRILLKGHHDPDGAAEASAPNPETGLANRGEAA